MGLAARLFEPGLLDWEELMLPLCNAASQGNNFADTEQALEQQALRVQFSPVVRGIKPGTAGWEAQTEPLC